MFKQIKNYLYMSSSHKVENKKIAYQAFLGTNYGTILQSVALYYLLKGISNDVDIIGCNLFRHRKLPNQNLCNENNAKYHAELMRYNFEKFFNKFFSFNEILDSIPANGELSQKQKSEIEKYSYVICGSDQVWRPSKFWFCKKRYLNYASKNKNITTIGYAPSVVISAPEQIPEIYRQDWVDLISNVDHISSREVASSLLITSLTGKKCTPVIDPTLTITKEQWNAIINTVGNDCNLKYIEKIKEKGKKDYMLVYMLDYFKFYKKEIIEISKYFNLEPVFITGREWGEHPSFNIEQHNTDPFSFFKLVANASLVLCDGFHGVCLSLINNSNFIYFPNPNNKIIDGRFLDLMHRFNLYSNLFSKNIEYKNFINNDWDTINELVSAERIKSLKFLYGSFGV